MLMKYHTHQWYRVAHIVSTTIPRLKVDALLASVLSSESRFNSSKCAGSDIFQ